MADYADWTDSIELLGSVIMVPFDVQGATIMMPMDFQGQTIDLKVDVNAQTIGNLSVDIKAQTVGNLNVNIAASAATLNVNISSQTGNINVNIAAQGSNVTISVAAQSVGVYLQPEWAASQQTDKNLVVVAQAIGNGGRNYVSYTVPSGKTLMITHVGGYMYAADVANADKNHIMAVSIYDYTTDTRLFWAGGNGGVFANPTKAIRIPTGHTIFVEAWNFASFSACPGAAAGGYEI